MEDTIFENEIALVLIVKNESRYIGEWLEYHYRIGVDKFYIYNNDSEDRAELLKILDPWIQAGVVDFEDASGKYRQMPVYNDAIERHRFDCRYMGFIDTDEFIYIKNGKTLPEFLNDHFSHDIHVAGLGINWKLFGSSGKQNYEPIDVIERFTMRAADNYQHHRVIKSIVNPRRVVQFELAHSATYMLSSLCDNEQHVPVTICYSEEKSMESIQCNHYFTKSVEEYLKKILKGRADSDTRSKDNKAINQAFNEVEDLELRDLWRKMKTHPLPNPKDHSQQKILENVRLMLSKFSDQSSAETILTCWSLVRRNDILGSKEKQSLENFLLVQLKRSLLELETPPWTWILVLFMTPILLSMHTDESIEILAIIRKALPQLLLIAECETRHELSFLIKQYEKIFDALH